MTSITSMDYTDFMTLLMILLLVELDLLYLYWYLSRDSIYRGIEVPDEYTLARVQSHVPPCHLRLLHCSYFVILGGSPHLSSILIVPLSAPTEVLVICLRNYRTGYGVHYSSILPVSHHRADDTPPPA